MNKIGIIETAPAFAGVSLREIEGALEAIDAAGYYAAECWGGAVFDACLRRLGEDPWARLRAVKRRMKNTPLQMTLRGQSLLAFRQYPDDIVRAFVRRAAECGIGIFRLYDGMNDLRNIETAADEAIRAGAAVSGVICYSSSPVHSPDTFMAAAKRLEQMGCASVCLTDTLGIMPASQCRDLVYALRSAVSLPVHLCVRDVYGLGVLAAVRGVEGGAEVIDCACASMSAQLGRPASEAVSLALGRMGLLCGPGFRELGEVNEGLRGTTAFSLFGGGGEDELEALWHGLPGEVLRELRMSLRAVGAPGRLSECAAEVERVRGELGYPPLVGPFGAIIAGQAVANVMSGVRYGSISRETRAIIAGEYGKPPGEIERELRARVLDGRGAGGVRFADMLEPGLDKARGEIAHLARGEDDILSYAVLPHLTEAYLTGVARQRP